MANYLYNGVELPDVYSADNSYLTPPPYRIVYKTGDEYRLAIFPVSFSYISKDGVSYIATNGERSMWTTFKKMTKSWRRHEFDAAFSTQLLIPARSIVWTSHDLLYENSTDIFLAATEPILVPDTEIAEPIDPQSYLMGFRLGQLLQGMRGKGEPVVPEPVLPESGVNPDTREITDTWEQIQQAIEESVYSTRYMLGDTKSFDMADGTAVVMQIVAFDADDKTDGTKAAISWVSRDIITARAMNATQTNENGWAACGMRSWLQGEFYENIPDEVKASIVSVNKTYYDNTTKTTLSCEDNVWIPSYRELFGDTSLEDSGAEYTGYFNSDASRIKYNASGSADSYFLRTARDSSSSNFRTIYVNGTGSYTGAINERGVVIGFCM